MQLHILYPLSFLPPSPFPFKMENKPMSGSSMDFSFMYLFDFSSAVNWPFINLHLCLKFVWLKHVPVISQRGVWLFLCPLLLNFLCPGPLATSGVLVVQHRLPALSTLFLHPRIHFKEVLTFHSNFSSVVGLAPSAFKKQQSSFWRSQVWL